MGQVVGRALYTEDALPFVNLQKNAVYDLWESFNDVAEGFGINLEEFKEICSVLQAPWGNIRKPALERLCESYTEFFFDYSETPLLVLDVNDVDFVANNDDYQKVVECLKREIKGREFVNLTPSFF